MRPTDENQPATRRPNLISSQRRGSGEINILAMLEGQTGRPLARRLTMLPVALWYGGAGLLAFALVGALAWLARDAGPVQHVQPTLASELEPQAAPELPAGPAVVTLAAADPEPPAAPAVASAVAAAVVPPAAGLAPSMPAPIAAVIARPVSVAHAAAAPRPAPAHAARPAPARANAPAPRARRSATASRVKPAAEVDTDVALISAIIQHGASHPPPAGVDCGDRACGATLPDQP